jgi:hypothetical protein
MQPAESTSGLQVIDTPAMHEQPLRLHRRMPSCLVWYMLFTTTGGNSEAA